MRTKGWVQRPALLLGLLAFALASPSFAAAPSWRAGVAKTRITPGKPLWMGGFAMRTHASTGTLLELNAKALALEDQSGKRAVLVTADLIGFPAVVTQRIAARVDKEFGIPRERLLLNASHTHSGPVLAHPLQIRYRARMSEDQWRDVEDYTRELEDKIVALAGAALKDLAPARLRFGHGQTDFAVNRRRVNAKGAASAGPNPTGPVDRDVPVLRVESPDGRLRAVVFGYACHNTTLITDNYQYCGDYSGFAQEQLEKRHPEAVALFLAGCGADANPTPRGTVELARKYGTLLADAVDQALGGSLKSVRGPLTPRYEVFPLAFAPPPTRQELEAHLKDKDEGSRLHAQELLKILDREGRLRSDYPYTVEVWRFDDDLTFIGLAGEVVVDYVLRLKKELGADKLWVAGYCNDVFGYVPSERVLKEGGYEGGGAMVGSRLPGPFAPGIEENILRKVRDLAARPQP